MNLSLVSLHLCIYFSWQQQYVFIHDCVRDYVERKKKELQGNLLYENVNRGFGKQCVLIVCTCVFTATIHFHPRLSEGLSWEKTSKRWMFVWKPGIRWDFKVKACLESCRQIPFILHLYCHLNWILFLIRRIILNYKVKANIFSECAYNMF